MRQGEEGLPSRPQRRALYLGLKCAAHKRATSSELPALLYSKLGVPTMIRADGCRCPMCRTERQLIASLEHSNGKNAFQKLCDLCPPIRKFSSISEFISHLHTTDGNSERHRSNDQLLSALLRALAGNQSDSVLQAVLTLAFIPALHRTSRDVSYLFPSLYEQDVCQQVLATFLRVSFSRSIQRRTGFVPIAITRTVRKIVFRWAFREVHEAQIQKEPGSSNPNLARPDPFESYLLLRDFFQHCERTGVLAASEQHVLTKLKLEGLSAKQLAQLEGSTSEEAVHHRSYRIMARLRKAASRLRSHTHR